MWRGCPRNARATMCAPHELILYGFVGDLQTFINDREGFAQLIFVNTQRRIGIKSVPAHDRIEALFAEEFSKRDHFIGRTVKRCHRLASAAAADQFDDAEQSDGADLAD